MAEFWNSVGSIPVGDNSPSIGGWIVWPPVIQYKEPDQMLEPDWDLTMNYDSKSG